MDMSLSWTAATDNVGLSAYLVFRGATPTALSQIATTYPTSDSFINYPLAPATTYYYSVQAVDTSGNLSPMSAVVGATTLALPSAPAKLVAIPTSTTKIALAWTAAKTSMPIAAYYVFRGKSPTSLSQVGATALTTYTDSALTAATKYYYAVQVIDQGGNLSPMSAVASATTLTTLLRARFGVL